MAVAKGRVDYPSQIQPLFDRYCVACHACFDAPCQLDLTHPDGLARGASKAPVYDAKRINPAPPTRLFIDAGTVAEWREKGFFSVLDGSPSVLSRLLNVAPARTSVVKPLNEVPGPELGRKHSCPAPQEIDRFSARHPGVRMPLSFPGLQPAELELINRWLAEGAELPRLQSRLSASEQRQMARWEAWLNQDSNERALLARWLFEHWYYAQLYFDGGATGQFFRLVRSATPPGQAVKEIATRRPNEAPGQTFYYRLLPKSGTRVYKTHITFALHDALLARIEALFLAEPWRLPVLPGYSERERSNPFLTFAAIPAKARYRFMLEHAEYFIRTFIRGPVCRGQVATAVIRDHFWVLFQSPESDPFLVDANYRAQVNSLLDLPGIEDDLLSGASSWLASTDDRDAYLKARQAKLAALAPEGAGWQTLWDGDGHNTSALLTVFRHHDSATVKAGWIGRQPQSVWLMDYPLLERSYYNLVVNFDVFGNIAHQAQTRLYFDLIRNGAEQNFLRLLPAGSRQQVLDEWYDGSGKLKLWLAYTAIDTTTPSQLALGKSAPKQELLRQLLERFATINAAPDPINRQAGHALDRVEAELARLAGRRAADTPAINLLPNASIIKVPRADGSYRIYTMVRNRQHSNVAFVLGESLRYQPERDTVTLVPGVATSYINFIFHVPAQEVGDFIGLLVSSRMEDEALFLSEVVARWGIAREHKQFWTHFHQVNDALLAESPLQWGILDIYRYHDFSADRAWILPRVRRYLGRHRGQQVSSGG